MPAFGRINRTKLIRTLKLLGFTGPYSGGKHQFMEKGDVTVVIPNPHQGDIGRELLARLLKQAGVSKDTWEQL